ncbi:MAG: nucleotidyltransferase domain-containing protein [Methanosarcinales archaeon Met12]|nr:MAG: nucleotidyltransferase domain-containing protein [Methanosarcinales archaeon Met12]
MGEKKSELIDELKQFKNEISKKHDIRSMILFGSRSKGMGDRHSDVDLLLVSDEFKDKSTLERPCQFYLEWSLDYPVDFLCFTPEEFEKKKKQITIVRKAVEEGIEI